MQLNEIVKKKRVYIPSILFVLYTMIGFLLVPIVGKNILSSKLSTMLERSVTIEKISVNPFLLTADLSAINIADKKNDVLYSSQKISANASWASVFTFSLIVSEFKIENPIIHIIRYKNGTFNFSDLMDLSNAKPSLKQSSAPSSEQLEDLNEASSKKIFGFTIKNFNIDNGRIIIEDKMVDTEHKVNKFTLSVPFISSKEKYINTSANLMSSFLINQTQFNLKLASTPFAENMATKLILKTDDINGLHYLSYIPVPETLFIKDLNFNLDLDLDFKKIKQESSLFLQGKIQTKNVELLSSKKEELLKVPFLNLNILPSDLIKKQIHLSKSDIGAIHLNISRDKNGEINLFKLLEKTRPLNDKKKEEKVTNSPEFSFLFTLDEFEMKNGTIVFQDNTNQDDANQDGFKTVVSPIDLRIKDVKVDNQMIGSYKIDLKTESNEIASFDGEFTTGPLNISTNLMLKQIPISKYASYYSRYFNGEVKNGNLDLITKVELAQNGDVFDLRMKTKEFDIQSLTVIDPLDKDELINIPALKITNIDINVLDKKVTTESISSHDGNIFINRLKNGKITLLEILKTFQNETDKTEPAKSDNQTETKLAIQNKSDWNVSADLIDIKNYALSFIDATPVDKVSVNLSNIEIKAANVKNFGEEKSNIISNLKWNDSGVIQIGGNAIISKSVAELDVSLDKIDIKSVQPYFTEAIKILVTSGDFNTKGKIKVDFHKPEDPNISFIGESSVTNFISLDKKTATDFFKCNSLYLSGFNASVFPIQIAAKDISLTDFYSRIIVSESGEINLNTILSQDKPADKPQDKPDKNIKKEKVIDSSKKKSIPSVQVDTITLQGGNVNFSDYLTQPNFAANMKQIAGSIKGLSSDEAARAKLHLKGLHGQSSPLSIIGSINPLSEKKFVDIDISFNDIELTNFTPYSSKYLGYKIEKGKLVLDLEYLIDGEKLKSENRLRFDNFTLGERVPSEDATNLPIGLAISLLQDSKGIINLDLPVTGELNDPEFSIGSIVFKMIANLMLKVVTSPFSIIGSLFGGGEELEYVDFKFGEDLLEDGHINKLETLATILSEKPTINLDIQASYNKTQDAEALRKKGFIQLLKAEKLKSMISSDTSADTLEEIELKDEEIDLFVNIAYDQAQFPKPRDDTGNEKELDIVEKKKLLITSVAVDKNDLRLLAMSRSEKIKSYLLSTNKVDNQRIFLLEPLEKDHADDDVASRVKFSLK